MLSQALLANISVLYAIYHGPKGLQTIADRVHGLAGLLATGAKELGHKVEQSHFFDTVRINVGNADKVVADALKAQVRHWQSSWAVCTCCVRVDECKKAGRANKQGDEAIVFANSIQIGPVTAYSTCFLQS